MLQSLSIRNIALIDELTVSFHSGLQVLTGETGAGKSIVVDAVHLILGGRADRGMIRSGCEKAYVEAVFDIPQSSEITALLMRESIESDQCVLTVSREISLNGKNLCRVCGVIVSLSFLKELTAFLLNLHGQSEHQLLADPRTHLSYLDQLGNPAHQQLLLQVRDSCQRFLTCHRAYAKLVRRNENKDERMERIRKDLEELRQTGLQAGEEDSLRTELVRMEKNARLAEEMRKAYRNMISGDSDGGALQLIRDASKHLQAISGTDEETEALFERCNELYFSLEDLAYQLNHRIEQYDDDPVQMEQTEARLDMIRKLKKRFGPADEDVLGAQAALEAEFDELDGLEDDVRRTAAEHKRLLSEYRELAKKLTQSRTMLAESLASGMMRELADLGMKDTVFQVKFAESENHKPKMPADTGDDQLEFMISPNPGEPLMQLAKIASGGELSRLMLALKTLEAGHTGIDCMVFDEIDTGISGKAAQTVAEKLIAISRFHQVICVTHLPQLAAAGDFHYLVQKQVVGQRTQTFVSELAPEGRTDEIARMISGADGISPDAQQYARQMLNAAEKRKQS